MDIRSVWHQTECGKEMNISIVTVDFDGTLYQRNSVMDTVAVSSRRKKRFAAMVRSFAPSAEVKFEISRC
jgi:hypothetical protein